MMNMPGTMVKKIKYEYWCEKPTITSSILGNIIGIENPSNLIRISHCYWWLLQFNSAVVFNLPGQTLSLCGCLLLSN